MHKPKQQTFLVLHPLWISLKSQEVFEKTVFKSGADAVWSSPAVTLVRPRATNALRLPNSTWVARWRSFPHTPYLPVFPSTCPERRVNFRFRVYVQRKECCSEPKRCPISLHVCHSWREKKYHKYIPVGPDIPDGREGGKGSEGEAVYSVDLPPQQRPTSLSSAGMCCRCQRCQEPSPAARFVLIIRKLVEC